jgi:Protein of unknown function (DUF3990)
MPVAQLLNPAPDWLGERTEFLTLWHGCTLLAKDDIEAHGIDLARCAPNTDFGRGFYTTTLERQAREWAWDQHRASLRGRRGRRGNPPVVLRFRVRRYTRTPRRSALDDGLDGLASLHFVRGEFEAEEFWSFVQHCRQSQPACRGGAEVVHDHRRPPKGWYQLVTGPVAAFWKQRMLMAGSDQWSFHEGGTYLLDALVAAGKGKGPDGTGDPDFYQWSVVS